MPALVVVGLNRHPLGLQRFVNYDAVLGHHIPIIERMGHQCRGLHPGHVVLEIAGGPEVVVVPCDPVPTSRHFPIPDRGVAVLPALRIPTVDEIIEEVDVLPEPSTRMSYQTVGAVVPVVGRVRSDGNDRLQPVHAGGCGRKGNGTVVGGPGHSHLSGRPLRENLHVPIGRSEPFGSPVQPIDDGFGRQSFGRPTDSRTALGKARARCLRVDDGETPRYPGIDL